VRDLALRFHAADVRLTDRLLARTPLHPAFWVYRRIRQAVATAARTHAKGRLLDIGCGSKPYEDLFRGSVTRHVGLEPAVTAGYGANRADVVADAAAVPLADASCDTVLCTEVLEHVRSPASVVSEMGRVLRPGGVAIVTAPFVYPVHDRHDYGRFTASGLRELFPPRSFEVLEVRALSSPAMTLCIMAALVVHDLWFLRNRYGYALSIPLRPFLWLVVLALNALGGLGDVVSRSASFPFNHVLVARRRS
jgi:SAM-dependent methyltransferase